VFGDMLYAVIIAMSLLTSIIAPPFLALLLKTGAGDAGSATGREARVPDS